MAIVTGGIDFENQLPSDFPMQAEGLEVVEAAGVHPRLNYHRNFLILLGFFLKANFLQVPAVLCKDLSFAAVHYYPAIFQV